MLQCFLTRAAAAVSVLRETPVAAPRGFLREGGVITRERERESDGTGFLFEEPNPTGSRPSDLIGLYKRWHQEERPLAL